ncbi:hypothetical protein STTU_4245 [Streptomyces sp. Tu6071]|nr:hypothetical protein STTU_4245 [Streptomyces sp. Tu6071]
MGGPQHGTRTNTPSLGTADTRRRRRSGGEFAHTGRPATPHDRTKVHVQGPESPQRSSAGRAGSLSARAARRGVSLWGPDERARDSLRGAFPGASREPLPGRLPASSVLQDHAYPR